MSDHLTNIVVVGLIHDEQGRIFIARRAATKAVLPEQFEVIGGHVEPGETLEDGLKREIMEEIGCSVKVGQVVHAFTYQSENVFKVEIAYLCTLDVGHRPTLRPDDHSESRWIESGEIDILQRDDGEVESLKKAFKILEGKK